MTSEKEPLEIEYRVEARTRSGTRILRSGKVEELKGSSWVVLAELDEAAMDRLRGAVASAKFFDLPATIEPPEPTRDGTKLTFVITLGKRSHTVVARQGTKPLLPALKQLNDDVMRVVSEALAREADLGTSD